MDRADMPIVVFDSGVGGISVLKEMVKGMPYEDFIYYGDSANAPFGTKSTEYVRDLTISRVEEFLERGVKAVAIACNSATSAAVRPLRQMYPELPLVGIEPALKPACLESHNGNVLVMATPMTIREEKFQKLVGRFEDQATIYQLPCPGLMEFVESGNYNSKEVKDFLEQLLYDYKDVTLNAAVLGCTHYPFVRKQIQEVLGDGVTIYDGALGTAKELKRRITEANLERIDKMHKGVVKFENSNPTKEKMELCERLFGYTE